VQSPAGPAAGDLQANFVFITWPARWNANDTSDLH
jgi:hypothetical protein